MAKAFFCNSGAEANECAVKIARKYGEKRGAYQIVTLNNSFHGRTLTTLAATGQAAFHQDFLPLTEGFVYAEGNDLSSVEALLDSTCLLSTSYRRSERSGNSAVPLLYEKAGRKGQAGKSGKNPSGEKNIPLQADREPGCIIICIRCIKRLFLPVNMHAYKAEKGDIQQKTVARRGKFRAVFRFLN